MNRDEAIRRAEALLSQVRGDAEYQWRNSQWRDEWFDFTNPPIPSEASTFMSDAVEIRIKPKPLECWVWHYGRVGHSAVMNCTDKPTNVPFNGHIDGEWVRMREVE